MIFTWNNVKLWFNANFRITEGYDRYVNAKWIEQHGNENYPTEIEIETLNRCNGKCAFCPVNVNMPQREYAKMPEELFHKIIEELSDCNYKGQLSLYSNNEPFLDERIIDFHEYARAKLPGAYFILFTNGSLLDLDKLLRIVEFLDYLVIDNYNDSLHINENLKEIYQYLHDNKELRKKVRFSMRRQNEVLYSRGGGRQIRRM